MRMKDGEVNTRRGKARYEQGGPEVREILFRNASVISLALSLSLCVSVAVAVALCALFCVRDSHSTGKGSEGGCPSFFSFENKGHPRVLGQFFLSSLPFFDRRLHKSNSYLLNQKRVNYAVTLLMYLRLYRRLTLHLVPFARGCWLERRILWTVNREAKMVPGEIKHLAADQFRLSRDGPGMKRITALLAKSHGYLDVLFFDSDQIRHPGRKERILVLEEVRSCF